MPELVPDDHFPLYWFAVSVCWACVAVMEVVTKLLIELHDGEHAQRQEHLVPHRPPRTPAATHHHGTTIPLANTGSLQYHNIANTGSLQHLYNTTISPTQDCYYNTTTIIRSRQHRIVTTPLRYHNIANTGLLKYHHDNTISPAQGRYNGTTIPQPRLATQNSVLPQ